MLGPADRKRINIYEPYEVEYWTKKFGCSAAELEQAVHVVGIMADTVENYLDSKQFWRGRANVGSLIDVTGEEQ